MVYARVSVIAAMLLALPAAAQQPASPENARQPCERSKPGDDDVTRCKMAIQAERTARMMEQFDDVQAHYMIAQKDLERLQREQQRRAAQDAHLAEWFKAWFGGGKE